MQSILSLRVLYRNVKRGLIPGLVTLTFLSFKTTADPLDHLGDPYGHLDTSQFTVFAFSQTDPGQLPIGVVDTQVLDLEPDMNIRAWQKWSAVGLNYSDYDFSSVDIYHNNGIPFIGGGTAAALFREEADAATFEHLATRDALNELVDHGGGRHNGSMANPAFRDHIFNYIKHQIDGGVDGVFLDEVLGNACSGGPKWQWTGNECFDDYHLKDFNRYLLNKYPHYTVDDWQKNFSMLADNSLNPEISADDLENNFNYRQYLKSKGWEDNPINQDNPLNSEWGFIIANRAVPLEGGFLEAYYLKYWRELAIRIRDYARTSQGKEIYISSNGIFPYVDFNGFGLYNYNLDNDGEEVDYVPVKDGKLNGRKSLQKYFKNIKQASELVSNDAPVVLFIDWPTQMMTDYVNLSLPERKDFWQIYMAEAYANGLYYALHLKTSLPEILTATQLSMMDFFRDYARFYRKRASYYHDAFSIDHRVRLNRRNINYNLQVHPKKNSLLLHLNNHNYHERILPQKDIRVSLKLRKRPTKVTMFSPDFRKRKKLPFRFKGNKLKIKVDKLTYYNVLEIEFGRKENITNEILAVSQ